MTWSIDTISNDLIYKERRKGFIRSNTLGIMMYPWFSVCVVVKCPIADILLLLYRKVVNGQFYTGYKYLTTRTQGNKCIKVKWRPISKSLDSLTWRGMQSLHLLHCMQLHIQAHTHPANEGLYKPKMLQLQQQSFP